jgi:hypothetical protein
LSFIGAMAMGPTVPVQAQGFYLDAPGVHIGVVAIKRLPRFFLIGGSRLRLACWRFLYST